MKKFKVLTQWTYEPSARGVEKNSGEVVTVPDDAYTVRELFEKAAQGLLHPELGRAGVFAGDQDLDFGVDVEKLRHLDLAEREVFLRELADDIKAKRDVIAQAEAANKKKLLDEKREQDELMKEHRARKAQREEQKKVAERAKREGGMTEQ